jgi:glycine cleavage system transcriptional repressor
MSEQLVITALGKDRPGIVDELSNTLTNHDLNIEDSRMSVLGGEFAILMLVSGSNDSINAFIKEAPVLEDSLGMKLLVKTTAKKSEKLNLAPYMVEVVAMDHPGIVRDIARFFSSRNINILDLDTSRYAAAHTGTPMFALHMTVEISEDQPIGRLREEFVNMCDQLNLDAKLTAKV